MKVTVLFALAPALAAVASASAQVTVDSTLNAELSFGNPGAGGEQVVASFDASASDKLVVVISTEHSFGITTAFSVDGMEYNGQAMIEAVQENSVPGAAALYYLDAPGPAGEIRAFMGMKNGALVTVYALSGTTPGVAATGQSTTDSVALTTTTANSLVIASILDGGQASNGNGAGAPTTVSPLIQVHSGIWGGNLWGGHGSGYQIVASPGVVTPAFTTLGPVRLRTVAAAFGATGSGLGTNYCGPAVNNSTGLPAVLTATGSDVIADNNLNFVVGQLPLDKFGYFVMGESQGFLSVGQGFLCLSLPFVRFNTDILDSGATGQMLFSPDLANLPAGTVFQPGDTWNFQCWYRDLNPGNTSNLSDAVSIQFQ